MSETAPPPFTPLTVHASAYGPRVAAGLAEALAAGRLPGWLLYQGDAQARRWLAYHQAWSPSRADARVQALYRRAFAAAAYEVVTPYVHVVGLGCGGGRKDAELVQAVAERPGYGRPRRHYTPVDASPALVLEAAHHVAARHPRVPCTPLVADLEGGADLGGWLAEQAPEAACLHTLFGMLPNLPPATLLPWLRGLLRPGDALLCSANLAPRGLAADGERILAQYDNPPARAWYLGALEALGVTPETFALTVRAEPLEAASGDLPNTNADGAAAWRIVVRATPRRTVTVVVGERDITLPAGRPVQVFQSLRLTASAAEGLLTAAGLRVVQRWLHDDGEEGVFLCAR